MAWDGKDSKWLQELDGAEVAGREGKRGRAGLALASDSLEESQLVSHA